QPHRVHLIDVDLRWGVTRDQAENEQALDLCLCQVDECRPFFLGLLGERYGRVSPRPLRSDRFPWVNDFPGRSVTELEILHAIDQGSPAMRILLAFRDPGALDGVPESRRSEYVEADPDARSKLADLKQRLRASDPVRLDPYSCRWDTDAHDPLSRS